MHRMRTGVSDARASPRLRRLDLDPGGEPHRRGVEDPDALAAATTAPQQHVGSIETVDFRADIAAPGHGQAWDCRQCGRPWVRWNANSDLIDPAEGVHLLGPEDVI